MRPLYLLLVGKQFRERDRIPPHRLTDLDPSTLPGFQVKVQKLTVERTTKTVEPEVLPRSSHQLAWELTCWWMSRSYAERS